MICINLGKCLWARCLADIKAQAISNCGDEKLPKRSNSIMEREGIIERIAELGSQQPWNHSIELAEGVVTCNSEQSSQGKNLVKWERMSGFLESFSCKGKRILDIGCNDGFFSLKLAELGANVVAIEASQERFEKAQFVFETRRVSNRVQLLNMNIYDPDVEELGYFDLVLCMGFIHRVPDPFSVLSKLARLSDTLLLEFKAFEEFAYDKPYLMFDGRRSDPYDPFTTCYFIPSVRAVVSMLNELGIKYYGIVGNPKSRRVMMLACNKNLPALKSLHTLEEVNLLSLLNTFVRRFARDVFRALRGDFAKN